MNKSLIRSRWAAIGAAVAVTLGGGAVMVAQAETVTDSFTAIEPCRLLDTRSDVDPVATSKVENLGIRKGTVRDKAKGNTVDNDITVIFDSTAANNGSNNYTLQYGNTDFRPILGDCDAEFDLGAAGEFDGASPVALLLNVTTVSMTSSGFVTVYPWKALGSSGSGTTGRPYFSNLNPISTLPSVSNNVTVALAEVAESTYIPGVKCGSGSHSVETSSGSGIYSGSDCGGLDGFRLYNENGSTHVIIDVLGYYEGSAS